MRRLKRNKTKFQHIAIVIATIFLMLISGITFAFMYFEQGEEVDINLGVTNITSNIDSVIDLTSVSIGDKLVDSASFTFDEKTPDSYVRARLEFYSPIENLTRAQKNYLLALNSIDFSNLITTNVDGTKWLNTYDNNYYLVSTLNDELFEVVDTNTYYFINNLTFPSVADIERAGLNIELISDLKLSIKFQGIQSRNLESNEFESVVSIFDSLYENLYEREEYLVVYNTQGIINIQPNVVSIGGKVVAPSVPSINNYIFDGWFSDNAYTNEFDFNTAINKNYNIYVKMLNGNAITFYNEDKTTVFSKKLLAVNEVTVEPAFDLAVDSFGTNTEAVEGWYTDKSFTNRFVFGYPLSESISLYPKISDVTQGLSYTIESNLEVSVNTQSVNDTTIIIPEYYQGYPVTTITLVGYSVVKVVLPRTMHTIADYAFMWLSSLEEVIMPSTLRYIGNTAFQTCTSLKLEQLPAGLTTLTGNSFSDCSSITISSIPKGITSIGNYTFQNCNSITSMTLHSSITYIGDRAFGFCKNLQTVVIENENIESISGFNNCINLKTINIPNSVTSITDNTFDGCVNLELQSLPTSLISIGKYAFRDCKKIAIKELPSGVETISEYVFQNCSLLNFSALPSSVTSIGQYAFSNCVSLAIEELPSGLVSISSSAFENCYNLKITSIPTSITTIIGNPFRGCRLSLVVSENDYYKVSGNCIIEKANSKLISGFANSNIPSDVTSIGNYAFSNCINLNSINLSSNITSIGDSAFSGCVLLTSITIPNNVLTIGTSAFSSCTALSSVTIGSGVTTIGNYAFSNCDSLKNITLPSNITSIGTYLFSNSVSLSSVDVQCNITSTSNYMFFNCVSLSSVGLSNSLTKIGDHTFDGCISLSSITLPSNVTTIGWSAFSNCKNLINIGLPSSLKTIDRYAFSNCTSLALTSLPSGVTSIIEYAFRGCENLALTSLPSGITSIGDYAFSGCTSMALTSLPSGITSVGRSAFNGCVLQDNGYVYYLPINGVGNFVLECVTTDITTIVWPSNTKGIAKYAFYNCRNLTSVEIQSGTTMINASAFIYCDNLKLVYIPSSVTSIGSSAFGSNDKLIYVLCESSTVANLAKGKGRADKYIYAKGSTSFTGTSVKINNSLTIYTYNLNNYKWVKMYGLYYKCLVTGTT